MTCVIFPACVSTVQRKPRPTSPPGNERETERARERHGDGECERRPEAPVSSVNSEGLSALGWPSCFPFLFHSLYECLGSAGWVPGPALGAGSRCEPCG